MSDASAVAGVTQDFIFGTLATDDLRLDALRRATGGIFHVNRIDPPDPRPGAPVEVTVGVGPNAAVDRVEVRYTTDGTPGEASGRVELARGEVVWDTLLWGYRREWRGTLPPQPAGTVVHYEIAGIGPDGDRHGADPDEWTGTSARFAYVVDEETVPDWVREAVIYHVFVDRFAPGEGRAWNDAETLNDIWGGTIEGITERLPYLADLGVTCLWLSPVFPSPTHHGYDATDYVSVEPRLGTEADLVALFDAAHAHGMRVILDFVASHVSNEHPAFLRAKADPDSPEREWFTFREDGTYRSFFGVATMPQLDTDHPGAREYLIDAATYWLGRGADGFRLDYANGPTHAFWAAFRAATRATKPDSFTVGEIVETAELQRSYQGRLDGALDFLLLQQMRAFFAFDAIGPVAFDAFLDRHLAYFPDQFVLPSFLDNHDMNRFLWVAGGDTRRLKLAALCQFTLPYPPIVYYGTEVGLNQARDLEYPDGSRRLEESRVLMPWGEGRDADLLAFYSRLVALRKAHPHLWRGARRPLARQGDGFYAVAIGPPAGAAGAASELAVVALNRGPNPRRLALGGSLGQVEDLLATETGVAVDAGSLTLAPWSGALVLGGRG